MDDNISLLKTIEKTYTNNELIEILVYKKNEIDDLFLESSEELDRIGRKKDELNKLEENVRVHSFSGPHHSGQVGTHMHYISPPSLTNIN